MAQGKPFDVLIKLAMIGNSGAGKSALVTRYCDDTFSPSFISTVGVDFKVKTMNLDGQKVKVQIWDTAGQERFKTITASYYRAAHGIIIVYDVTDENSFKGVRDWMRRISDNASEGIIKLLVGNKLDMPKRVVETERGKGMADEFGMKFFETSAKEGTNVEDAFLAIVKEAKEKLQETMITPKPPNGGVVVSPGTGAGAKPACKC